MVRNQYSKASREASQKLSASRMTYASTAGQADRASTIPVCSAVKVSEKAMGVEMNPRVGMYNSKIRMGGTRILIPLNWSGVFTTSLTRFVKAIPSQALR